MSLKKWVAKRENRKRQSRYFPCRDGTTPSIITHYHTNVYKKQCGFLAKKSPQIHAKIKRYLLINELQDSPWHRPASATQYVTPETLTTVPPQRPPIRNSEDAYDRRKISTFLAGVIPDTFAIKFWYLAYYEIRTTTGICQDHLSLTPLGKRLVT